MAALQRHYVYTGEGRPPEDATHVRIHDSITVIPLGLFSRHQNILELVCHDGVNKIEADAFEWCPRLKRLVMPGVEELEGSAFWGCDAVAEAECDKLEIIRSSAFGQCKSLESIDLPSAKVVQEGAFEECTALAKVNFGKSLESIEEMAFKNSSLNRITMPLKSGLFNRNDVFIGCNRLDQVRLIEDSSIHETVDALLLDKWKNVMNEELDSINQTLPYAHAGFYELDGSADVRVRVGEKTRTIQEWIGRVLQKLIRYKVEHYRLLSLAAASLAHASPNGVVIECTLSFLQLPDHVFDGEGDNSATIPALDRQFWESVVEMEQRAIERDRRHEVADTGEATAHEGSFDPSKNRLRATIGSIMPETNAAIQRSTWVGPNTSGKLAMNEKEDESESAAKQATTKSPKQTKNTKSPATKPLAMKSPQMNLALKPELKSGDSKPSPEKAQLSPPTNTESTAAFKTPAMSSALKAIAPKLKDGIKCTRTEIMNLVYKEWLSQNLFEGESGMKRALNLYLGKDANYSYANICHILESGGTIIMKLMFLAEYPYFHGVFLLTNETEASANNGVVFQEEGGLEATAKLIGLSCHGMKINLLGHGFQEHDDYQYACGMNGGRVVMMHRKCHMSVDLLQFGQMKSEEAASIEEEETSITIAIAEAKVE